MARNHDLDKSLNCLFLLPKIKQDERRNVVMGDYTILHYEIYEYPQCPTDNGRYYGKTPLLEQAETVIKNAKESGKMLFLKAACSDGMKRYL